MECVDEDEDEDDERRADGTDEGTGRISFSAEEGVICTLIFVGDAVGWGWGWGWGRGEGDDGVTGGR